MRYRMLIEYNGSGFHGWQVQPNCVTVQETIEKALSTALRFKPALVGSGRTDTGVHARGQVAHFDVPFLIHAQKLKRSLNGLLGDQVGILELEETTPEFHARFDARLRCYHYYISTEKHPLSLHRTYVLRPEPDLEKMNIAAKVLLGVHDCSAFCRVKSETKNRVCTISEAVWIKELHKGDFLFRIKADRFLHGMVRAIVGTLLEIGQGKRAVEDMAKVLASQDRTQAGPAAPARGLVLENVMYER